MSDFELKPWNRGISDSELLDDLRHVANVLGKNSVRYDEYAQYGRCAPRTLERRFGSWNAALQAAGLEVVRRQNISDDELFENLERVWTALGRQPRREDIRKPLSDFSKGNYERRFGGWRAALERFVEYVSSEPLASPTPRPDPSPDTGSRFPNLRLRWKVLSEDRFCCRACGRSPAVDQTVKLHVDHIVPWSKGGRTSPENLQTLCEQCNLGKGDA